MAPHPSRPIRPSRPLAGRLRDAFASPARRDATLRARLEGRLAVITGASSGIGRATAHALASSGARLILVARDADALARVVQEVTERGGEAHAVPADLMEAAAVEQLVATVRSEWGAVDLLVNNAGMSVRRPLGESWDRFHDFERTTMLNYFAPLRLILGFAPGMCERGGGHIVNVSTIGAQCGAPLFSAYVASKGALDQFSRCAALELERQGVVFTTMYMGLVRTRMSAATELYEEFPAASAVTAAERIAMAIRWRPHQVSTGIGYVLSTLHACAPRATAWLFRVAHDRFHLWMKRRREAR